LATEFYTWDIPQSFKSRKGKVKTEQFGALKEEMKDLHAVKIPRPKCLSFQQLLFKIFFCQKFQPAWYKDYCEVLRAVQMDLDRTLNILDLIKRMRMHGFALTCLWDNDSRKFFSHQAHTKHIKEVTEFRPKTLW
jgi:hypothetical protein